MAAETAHFRTEGGSIHEMDLPLSEVMAGQVTKGYLVRVNPDGSPYTGPEPDTDSGAAGVTKMPAKSDTKAKWVGWAVHKGMTPDDAEALTKQDLIDKFGTP